jgi:phage gpG-like protein
MLEFLTLADLAHHLTQETVGGLANTHHGLEAAAQLLEDEARSEFGVYQKGAGPFGDWPELADATKQDRVRRGFTENDPELRSGELRDSLKHETENWEATIGSEDPVFAYQELGTANMPPRPILGIALYNRWEDVQRLIGNAAVSGFLGGDYARKLDDYDLSTPSQP